MRRICLLTFVLCYVASSYAVTQARTSFLVGEFEHSSRPSQAQVDGPCKQVNSAFPSYRQAKPNPIFGSYILQARQPDISPVVSERLFHVQTVSLKSIDSIDSIPSRAPPFLS